MDGRSEPIAHIFMQMSKSVLPAHAALRTATVGSFVAQNPSEPGWKQGDALIVAQRD